MAETVLVTAPEYAKGEAVFVADVRFDFRPAEPEEQPLADAVRATGARAVVVGVSPYVGPLYEALGAAAPAILARFGVGHDRIDKALAARHGIVVTNTPGVLDQSVAEHTFALLLALCRHVARGHVEVAAGGFRTETGTELGGKTLGLIGFGPIARRVARIASSGFGLQVIACGRRSPETLARDEGLPLPDLLARHGLAEYTDDPDRVLAADLVSLHLPGSVAGFLNAERLSRMRPGALLVNTARGSLIDEPALYDALAAGRLKGAALDVYAREPYQPVDPNRDLRTLPNVLLTPHVGSNTAESNARMAAAVSRNLAAFADGRLDDLNRISG